LSQKKLKKSLLKVKPQLKVQKETFKLKKVKIKLQNLVKTKQNLLQVIKVKMLKFQTIKSQHKREPQLMQLQAILKPLEKLNPLKML
jgi:hypothetical protein